MATNDIRTSYDLADALEGAVKALRAAPELPIYDLNRILASARSQKGGDPEVNAAPAKFRLEELARRFSGLARDEAEAELRNLTVDSIRQLAAALGIRIPSKATKGQATSTLLAHVFDIPAGQELIRTFHRRHAAP